jgi:hypothetical protein
LLDVEAIIIPSLNPLPEKTVDFLRRWLFETPPNCGGSSKRTEEVLLYQ